MRSMFIRVLPACAGMLLAAGLAAAVDTSIYDIQLGFVPPNTIVTAEGVVVTAVGRFGIFVQEPVPHDTWGRQYSGIWVYTNNPPTVHRGDLVNVTGGYIEYFNMSEIDVFNFGGSVAFAGIGVVPDPVLVTIPEVNNTGLLAEGYESVLIRVDRDDPTLLAFAPDQFNEWQLKRGVGQDSLKVDSYSALAQGDFEYDIPPPGTVLSFAQGILVYNFNEYKLAPRNCDEDLGYACVPKLRGAYATSSTGVAIQVGVPLNEASAESIYHYELVSGAQVLSATLDPANPKRVFLATENLGNGEQEEIIVNHLISSEGARMVTPGSSAFRTGITPIQTIQFVSNPGSNDISALIDEIVTIQGRVTGLDGANYYFLQDADGGQWDGIYVRVARNTPLKVGNTVKVTGRVNEYFGMTQVSYAAGHDYYIPFPTVDPVTTNVVTTSQVRFRDAAKTAEPWEGNLVRLNDARLDSISGEAGPYFGEWYLYQNANPDTARMDTNGVGGDKSYDACIGDRINLTGMVGYSFSQYFVWPRTGRGYDIEVIFDNPACAPTGVEEQPPVARRWLTTSPNPFHPKATIHFEIPASERVELAILDASGRLVRALVDGAVLPPGVQQVVWDGLDDRGHPAGAGAYFALLRTEAGEVARKMLLLK